MGHPWEASKSIEKSMVLKGDQYGPPLGGFKKYSKINGFAGGPVWATPGFAGRGSRSEARGEKP